MPPRRSARAKVLAASVQKNAGAARRSVPHEGFSPSGQQGPETAAKSRWLILGRFKRGDVRHHGFAVDLVPDVEVDPRVPRAFVFVTVSASEHDIAFAPAAAQHQWDEVISCCLHASVLDLRCKFRSGTAVDAQSLCVFV